MSSCDRLGFPKLPGIPGNPWEFPGILGIPKATLQNREFPSTNHHTLMHTYNNQHWLIYTLIGQHWLIYKLIDQQILMTKLDSSCHGFGGRRPAKDMNTPRYRVAPLCSGVFPLGSSKGSTLVQLTCAATPCAFIAVSSTSARHRMQLTR